MMAMITDPIFWVLLGQIFLVNIVLSGDNAVVIALAARSLPAHQQKQAVMWGAGAAVVMRIILTIVAVKLLELPYLRIIGALLLFWIAVQLLVPEDDDEDVEGSDNMFKAIKTILIADLVMSLDNVLGVAAVAKGNIPLLIIGLAISIPLVIYGAQLLMKLMDRWPIIITIGAGLLGWVAGEMLVTDPVWTDWIEATFPWLHFHFWKIEFNWLQVLGAAFVVIVGKYLAGKGGGDGAGEQAIVDLAAGDQQNQPNR